MILNFGSLNIDHVYRVEHFVQPGETLATASYSVFAGDKGANQSMALARAGVEVAHAGKLGQDANWLKDKLAAAGVNTDAIELIEGPSGHAIIQVNPAGENCILLHGGANQKIDPPHLERAFARCRPGDTLLLQNEINANAPIMRRAAKLGMKIVLNPAPMDDRVRDYPLDLVAIFIVNQIEAAALTGETEIEAILAAFRSRWSRAAVILTLGAAGAAYAGPEGRLEAPAAKVEAVDTTGAGDTFIGYFLAGLTAGEDLETCLKTACKAAAVCVSRPGAMDSIPARSEL